MIDGTSPRQPIITDTLSETSGHSSMVIDGTPLEQPIITDTLRSELNHFALILVCDCVHELSNVVNGQKMPYNTGARNVLVTTVMSKRIRECRRSGNFHLSNFHLLNFRLN